MDERPILFNDAMVRAILSGAKTQTRRPVDMRRVSFIGGRDDDHNDPALWGFADADGCWHVLDQRKPAWTGSGVPHESYAIACPFGAPGDFLWVREAHAPRYFDDFSAAYRADYDASRIGDVVPEPKWTPSIHMRRADSRLTLRVTDVRVERVRDITEEDALAECAPGGVPWLHEDETYRTAFRHLWASAYGPESWTANSWVWVVSFDREVRR